MELIWWRELLECWPCMLVFTMLFLLISVKGHTCMSMKDFEIYSHEYMYSYCSFWWTITVFAVSVHVNKIFFNMHQANTWVLLLSGLMIPASDVVFPEDQKVVIYAYIMIYSQTQNYFFIFYRSLNVCRLSKGHKGMIVLGVWHREFPV